jgi:ribonuclease HI
MDKVYLFTDGSVNPQSKVGIGGYILLDNLECLDRCKVITKKFENTSSTKLELETLLWAFDDLDLKGLKAVVYTDCQNIMTLLDRREKLEKKAYKNSKGLEINNASLYKEFFKTIDAINCEFIKVKGHKKSSLKDNVDEIFTLVDKTTRRALRESV